MRHRRQNGNKPWQLQLDDALPSIDLAINRPMKMVMMMFSLQRFNGGEPRAAERNNYST